MIGHTQLLTKTPKPRSTLGYMLSLLRRQRTFAVATALRTLRLRVENEIRDQYSFQHREHRDTEKNIEREKLCIELRSL